MKLTETIHRLKHGEELKIVAIGDSLTQGWMVGRGYVDFLNEMISKKYPESRFRLINRGIPGDTAEGGLHRLMNDVIKLNPDLVLVQFALNDLFCGYSSERFKNNMKAIVRGIKENTLVEILLVTSVPVIFERERAIADEFYEIMQKIADDEDVSIAPVHKYWEEKISEGVDFYKLVQEDSVHPTEAGYRLMAEAIMKEFD